MDPQIPTSFIPKRPVTNSIVSTSSSGSHATGLLSLLTVIVTVATVLSLIGVVLFEKSLVSQKERMEQSIGDARSTIGADFLTDMKRLNARIGGVKELLQTHIVISPIFSALEATTLRSIQYKSFQYQFTIDPATKEQLVQVTLTGEAKNYSSIALQSDAYAQNTLIKNPVFSDLTIDDKTSVVKFRLTFDVAPADLSFQTFIDAKAKSQSQSIPSGMPSTPPPTTGAPTSSTTL
ncbi:hypothetical protein IT401_00035 [Candidatus Nomurabacteria bacterium]|nr:hypothetical protein [Candidatus Nomurabacteria bacterium]